MQSIYITAFSCSHVPTEKKSVPHCSLTVTARAHHVCYQKPSATISPCCYRPLSSCHMHSIYISQLSHVAMFPPRKKVCRIALSPSLRVLIVCVTRSHQLQSVPAAIGLCVLATCTAYIYIYIYITAVSCSHVSTEKKSVPHCSLTLTARVHLGC